MHQRIGEDADVRIVGGGNGVAIPFGLPAAPITYS